MNFNLKVKKNLNLAYPGQYEKTHTGVITVMEYHFEAGEIQ